jgi:hypothetical protein
MPHQIGSRVFDDLRGPVIIPTPTFDVEAFAGQDGLTAFAVGTRGQPFELESEYVASSYAAAITLQNSMYADPGLSPQSIVRETENYSGVYGFIILGVTVRIESAAVWIGRRSGVVTTISPAYRVLGRYRLVAVTL